MQSRQRLRDELRFTTEFNALFDVMQQLAVSQLRRADEQSAHRIWLTDRLQRECFPLLPPSARNERLVRGGVRGRLLVVFTSEEGFVGPLYAAVMRTALALVEEATQWMLVGQRGLRWLETRAQLLAVEPMPSAEEADARMRRLSQTILTRYRQLDLRDVWLIAPRFVSMTRQEVKVQQLLPLPLGESGSLMQTRELILEPSVEAVVQQLASLWVEAVCVEAFWSGRRAELAARALHVEVARGELSKRARIIRYELFKAMHERVDVLVRETCIIQRHAVSARAMQRGG